MKKENGNFIERMQSSSFSMLSNLPTSNIEKLKNVCNIIMGGPGSGPNPGNGSSEVSEEDYKTASEDPIYASGMFDDLDVPPVNKFEPTLKERLGDLTKEEGNTVNAYSDRGYKVNQRLREGELGPSDKAYVRNLEASLDKLPSEGKGTLWRGEMLTQEALDNIQPGTTYNTKGFTSTTKDKSVLKNFLYSGKSGTTQPVTFKISSHSNGKHISDLSTMRGEGEVLFKTDTKWKVVSKKGNVITIKEDK
jgi:hypothetical protein